MGSNTILIIIIAIVFAIIFFVIIGFAVWESNRSSDCGPCNNSVSQSVYVGAPAYFNKNFPYFNNGTDCVTFDDASPLGFTLLNSSPMAVKFFAEGTGSDATCSSGAVNLWTVPPNTSFRSGCAFARVGQITSWFNGLSIACVDETNSNTGIPLTFQGSDPTIGAVSISVPSPNTQKLDIVITGNTQNGDGLVTIVVV